MKYLTENELKDINGGMNFGVMSLIAGAITFIIGVLDGITRPLKCR